MTFGVAHLPPGVEVIHTCENITFASFATQAVIIILLLIFHFLPIFSDVGVIIYYIFN